MSRSFSCSPACRKAFSILCGDSGFNRKRTRIDVSSFNSGGVDSRQSFKLGESRD
ncbi:hypothetical protein DPMN_054266 [Dreissena polymorpha]|uniref:Uncharacterized protein n=1 Tax=Dreissena polymorpha TaxID=45954 RepID=A0A9D4CNL1_DREPO|nr:hypothetical protein DPMN_054266 [Dreissena polymorpha]